MTDFFKKIQNAMKKKEYYHREYHEGMAYAIGEDRECGYVNCNGKLAVQLTDKEGNITFAGKDDIDWNDEIVKEYGHSVKRLRAEYYIGGNNYKNGVALVQWTLLPDGRYFADDDGYGAEDNDEVNIYCYIDKKGKVIIPFQGMTEEQIEKFKVIAEERKD